MKEEKEMRQTWTLHVENFARIKKADIQISPLMCFIGDNNSGKSYLMSLLWGLIASGRILFQHVSANTMVAKDCEKWLLNNIGKNIIMDETTQRMYIAWFNELLSERKDELVEHIFNYKIDIGKVQVCNYKWRNPFVINVDYGAGGFEISLGNYIKMNSVFDDKNNALMEINAVICWNILMGDMNQGFPLSPFEYSSVYLPASRTGLLLTYRKIINQAISVSLSARRFNSFRETLTLPYIKFLQFLNNMPSKVLMQENDVLIPFIKKHLTSGELNITEDRKYIRYKPTDMIDEIPLSVTSSVVTEISPLILLLETATHVQHLVIEEPEAHLHPALQKKIAQLIIQFVRSGIPVWITTHSDTILQHFNNMLKLKNHPDCEKLCQEFSYTEKDLLDKDEITLYQFTREESATVIERLQPQKYGFVIPSFNDANDKMLQEILAFQEED